MTRYKLNSFAISFVFALSCVLLAAGAASAQTAFRAAKAAVANPGIEVDRDARELQAEIRPRPDEPDVADTALVFTNVGGRDQMVKCVGFDSDGHPVGRIWLKLPALGLRYALASDLSRDRDFIGSAHCSGGANVVGSVVLLGPDLTDLPVLQPKVGQSGRIRFPLVATF